MPYFPIIQDVRKMATHRLLIKIFVSRKLTGYVDRRSYLYNRLFSILWRKITDFLEEFYLIAIISFEDLKVMLDAQSSRYEKACQRNPYGIKK